MKNQPRYVWLALLGAVGATLYLALDLGLPELVFLVSGKRPW
jgi:hypothetical protein